MSTQARASLLSVLVLSACASATVPAPGQTSYANSWTSMALVESPGVAPSPGVVQSPVVVQGPSVVQSPAVAPPANDIPESVRIAWFEAHRPPPVYVERVVVHETAPVRYVREYERSDDWVAPVSFVLGLGLGYWWGDGGHHGHHHGHHGYHH